jgi:hypothetical protein
MAHRPQAFCSALALAALVLLIGLSSACARNYVEQPALRATQSPDADLVSVLAALLSARNTSAFVFCEADPETGECEDAGDGLSAIGLGGYALPLLLDLSSLSVEGIEPDDEGWTFRSRFRSKVNGIPPLCTRARGTVRANGAGSANIEFDRFYCNWALIGNVLTKVELSIDSVDLEAGVFRGYYALSFNGTGNAAGSGYFRASPRDGIEAEQIEPACAEASRVDGACG